MTSIVIEEVTPGGFASFDCALECCRGGALARLDVPRGLVAGSGPRVEPETARRHRAYVVVGERLQGDGLDLCFWQVTGIHVKIGDEIELRPGHVYEEANQKVWKPIVTKVMGLKTGKIKQRLGYKPYDEVIHRDNLAVTGENVL